MWIPLLTERLRSPYGRAAGSTFGVSREDQTFKVNKLFIICMAFCFVLVSPWALRENNALELANKSARCVGYKHNPNNKCVYSIYSTDI